ncbi:hypothetical protein ACFV20_03585 [Streptomyces sp. NPDC059696]|uniref:hypothetical protein n=1 Tax=Streptomyces sp. NPDC059696 TaxID=3346911 RepID=UPI0036BA1AB2
MGEAREVMDRLTDAVTGHADLKVVADLYAGDEEIRIRGVDIAAVEDGRIVDYRLYFDEVEFLGELGLLPADAPF